MAKGKLSPDVLARHHAQGYLPVKCHRIYTGKEGKKNINILLQHGEAVQFASNMLAKLAFMFDENLAGDWALRIWRAGSGDKLQFGMAPIKSSRRKIAAKKSQD